MIVMKFGGTSVEDAAAIRNVARIIVRELDRAPLVVVSACSGVTTALIRAAQDTAGGDYHASLATVSALRERHTLIADELSLDGTDIATLCDELERLAQQRLVEPHFTTRLIDQFASFGERLSSLLLTRFLESQGIQVCLLDARKVIVTDEQFTSAIPQFAVIEEKAREYCRAHLEAGTVVVTQGFIGATPGGLTTTIGRGGSDYSAAIFGAALDAEEIQIWTDVDGILTADPSILPEARPIKQMTFREAAELAYFGAKVLHPKTILPAVRKNIPVRVLNSKRPESDGTSISTKLSNHSPCIVKSIAYKEGITLVHIESTRMLMAHGFLARLFEVFAHHHKAVDVIATSEIGVSLTIDDATDLDKLLLSLCEFADVTVQSNRAVVCIVGEDMRSTRGVASKVFTALDRAHVNVELISHGGSEINLTLVIREEDILAAVKTLHKEFFENEEVMQDVFHYDLTAEQAK